MKRSLIGLLLFGLFSLASAQDEQLISDKIESGGFGAPVWKVTQVNGETAFLTGGRGGWIINHTFVIGGGYGTLMDVDVNAEINVLKWMRVNVGAGYRLVSGVNIEGLSNGDLGGPEAQVTVKFGSF